MYHNLQLNRVSGRRAKKLIGFAMNIIAKVNADYTSARAYYENDEIYFGGNRWTVAVYQLNPEIKSVSIGLFNDCILAFSIDKYLDSDKYYIEPSSDLHACKDWYTIKAILDAIYMTSHQLVAPLTID